MSHRQSVKCAQRTRAHLDLGARPRLGVVGGPRQQLGDLGADEARGRGDGGRLGGVQQRGAARLGAGQQQQVVVAAGEALRRANNRKPSESFLVELYLQGSFVV